TKFHPANNEVAAVQEEQREREQLSGSANRPTPVLSVVRARERGKAAAERPIVLATEMLTKVYGNLVAANNVTLTAHEGSFVGIVGPNGAGKTTTLSMISGLN